jgi:predicted peptidase
LKDPEYGKAIDRDRLYLTGASMGGHGALRFAADKPGKFAAIAPVCPYAAREFVGESHKLKGTPIWLFHGDQDGLEDPSKPKQGRLSKNSEDLIEKLRSQGDNDTRITLYEGVGHSGAWIRAYDDPKLCDWLLSHQKAKP